VVRGGTVTQVITCLSLIFVRSLVATCLYWTDMKRIIFIQLTVLLCKHFSIEIAKTPWTPLYWYA
jgi:hypothetical protein